jgi:AsmA protein
MRTTRNIIIGIVAVVVLVAVVLGIAASRIDSYRPRVQAELQKKLDRPVQVGHLGLHLFPLSVRADSVTIGESPAFPSSRSFATANALYISVGLFSLIGGSPEVNDLILDQPQIELIHNKAGVWNFSTLGGSSKPGSSSGGTSSVSLNELKITDGQVAVTDEATNQPRSVYDHIDLKLTDFAQAKQFGLDVAAHLPGQGKQLLSFKGKAGPLDSANSAATPVDGHVSLQEVSVAGFNHISPGAIPPQTDAVLSGDADITSQGTQLSAKGNLKAQNVIAKGSKIDFPISSDFDFSSDRAKNSIDIRSCKLGVGPTSIDVSGSMDAHSTPSTVNLTLKTDSSSIGELAKLAGAFGVTSFNGGSGRLSANVHVQGPLSNLSALNFSGTASLSNASLVAPTLPKPLVVPAATAQFSQNSIVINNFSASAGSSQLQGSLSAKNFAAPEVQFQLSSNNLDLADFEAPSKTAPAATKTQTTTPASSQPGLLTKVTGSGTIDAKTIRAEGFVLNNTHAQCKLDNGVVTLAPLTTDIFGGKENGSVTLDIRPANTLCAVNAKFTGVDTNALLSAVRTAKDTLYGSLTADTNLHFALVSSDQLPRTLNGTLNFNVTNGELKNVNILNEISKVGKFLGSAPGQTGNYTKLDKLGGTLNIANGVASTNNLTAVLSAGSLAANCTIDLASQALNLHMTAALASGTSQAVGGTQVGGFLNTALANNKGELVIPVIVGGTMAHPSFTPDAAALAKMKLNNLLPSVSDPGKLANGLLSGGGASGVVNNLLGGKPSTPPGKAQQNQPKPADAVNSILNSFGKKKKQQ